MTYRVVQWSTGNVGRNAIAGILARPELELAGVWVSSDAKVGKDAGELAGLDVETGITATNDAQALIDLAPDCILYTAMADDRLMEALDDLKRFLEAGINVVSSSPVFLQFPRGVAPDEMVDPIVQAAEDNGVSIFVNGIDPGFANDALPLAITGISERIDEVRCVEVMNYDTYDQANVLFEIMGFAKPMDHTPMLLMPGVLTLAWGSVVRQIAAGLDVELDDIEEFSERVPAPRDFEVDAGPVPEGSVAGLHFEVRGMKDGRAVVVLEHATRLLDELAPDWPQPAGIGCYRVEVKGQPNYTVDLQLVGEDGDHNTGGLKATAMRLVNSVEHVIGARPGLVTALDLPLVTGRGLLA